jgi:four helix bundle protein
VDGTHSFDLEERTAKFGEAIIDFAKKIPHGQITNRLIDQLVGAGTSVGANYCEADDAVSKKEFRHRIGICKKEAREAKFFVRMVVRAVPELRESAKPLWQEAKELHLIFAKIYRRK